MFVITLYKIERGGSNGLLMSIHSITKTTTKNDSERMYIMKKYLRNVLCVVFALSMMVTMAVSASAQGATETKDLFRFVGTEQGSVSPLMESNGDFDFVIQYHVNSAKFIATSDTMTISTKAFLYCDADKQNHYDIDRKYTITLYKDGWLIDSKVGTLTAYSDWMNYSKTFSVENGKTYYLGITVTTSLVETSYTMHGQGNVSNIKLK